MSIHQSQLYARGAVTIGRLVWNAHQRDAQTRASRVGPAHLMVIPRYPVRITQHGAGDGKPFIADPASAVFYNARQPYVAEQLVEDGEETVYFGVDASFVHEVAAQFGAARRADDADRPLPFTHGPCDPRSFALHRRLLAYLDNAGHVEPLAVEETVTWLLGSLLRQSFAARGMMVRRHALAQDDRRRDDAEAARVVLLRSFREPLGLRDVADRVGLSAHHLCRIFRRYVGRSMHQYRIDLRLRASIEPLCEANVSLAALALDLGFNSQSHFTAAFTGRFGIAPARFRRDARAGRAPVVRSRF